MRRINKDNAFFNGTKCIVTLTDDQFDDKFNDQIEKKLKNDGATAKDLRMYENLDYMTLMKAAISYSNGVIISSPNVSPELVAHAQELKKPILDFDSNEAIFYEKINEMYDTVAGSNLDNYKGTENETSYISLYSQSDSGIVHFDSFCRMRGEGVGSGVVTG